MVYWDLQVVSFGNSKLQLLYIVLYSFWKHVKKYIYSFNFKMSGLLLHNYYETQIANLTAIMITEL